MKRLTIIFALLTCGLAYGSARDPSNFFYRVSPAGTALKIEPVYYAPKPAYPDKAIKIISRERGFSRFTFILMAMCNP